MTLGFDADDEADEDVDVNDDDGDCEAGSRLAASCDSLVFDGLIWSSFLPSQIVDGLGISAFPFRFLLFFVSLLVSSVERRSECSRSRPDRTP